MEYRTMIFALITVLLAIQIGISAGVIAGSVKTNMDAAGVVIPVLVLVGAGLLYWKKESKEGIDIEPPKFTLSQQ
jgi:hypothetical protein